MPVQTRSMRSRQQEDARRPLSTSASSFNPLTPSFVPSQRPGEDTIEYHRRQAIEAREVSSRYGITRQERRDTLSADTSRPALYNVKEILDTNVSTLYSRLINNDIIYNILTQKQLLYLRNDTILSNNLQRRLEFNYVIDIIEKFNLLINMIDIDKNNITDDDRYDINYYYEIINVISNVDNDYKIVSNKTLSTRQNVRDMQVKISNEKVILNELIRELDINIVSIDDIPSSQLTDDNRERKRVYEEFKGVLNDRLDKLNGIREIQLKELIHYSLSYEVNRKNLKKIIESALILLSTLKLLIVNIGILRNNDDEQLKDLIISDMMEAVELYTNTISSINNEELYRLSLELQQNIQTDVNEDINRTYLRNYIIDTNEYIRIQGIDTNYAERQRQAAQERLDRNLVYIGNSIELNRRRDLMRTEREARRIERLQAREARRRALQEAREARRLARPARTTRTTRTTRRIPQPQTRQVYSSSGSEANRSSASSSSSSGSSSARRAPPPVPAPVPVPVPPVRRARPVRPARARRSNVITIKYDDVDYIKYQEQEVDFIQNLPQVADDNYLEVLNRVKDNYLNNHLKINDANKTKLDQNYNLLKTKYATLFNKDEPLNGRRVDSINNYVGNSIVSLFVRYMKYDGDMKFNDNRNYYVINIDLLKDDNGVISEERQDGIDVGGLRRDFITALTSELFDKKIFINRDDSDKYYLNPEFEPDEFMRYIIKNKYINDDEYFNNEFINDFYKFLGQLLVFILVNDCGLDKNLSSYIISSLCNNRNFTDIDYIRFMIIDYPQFFNMFFNLMKKPEDIEYSYASFNDFYPLDETSEEGEDLTTDNIIKWLKDSARFMMTTSILRKNIEIRAGRDYKEIYAKNKRINELLIEGIPMSLRTEFSTNNFKPVIINSFIKTADINNEIINKIIDNLKTTTQSLYNYRSNPQLQNLLEIFINYVLKNDKGKHINELAYHNFIIKLLKFWSGSAFFKQNERYKIQINDNLSDTHLPQSHTCFFLIDIPNYTGTNDEIGEKLFNKIEIAISNVESGVGLAGGGRRRYKKIKQIKKQMKKGMKGMKGMKGKK